MSPFSTVAELSRNWQDALVGHFPAEYAKEYGDQLGRQMIDLGHGALAEDRQRELNIRIGHRACLNSLMDTLVTAARTDQEGAVALSQSSVFAALQTAPVSGTLTLSKIPLPDCSEWIDIEGSAASLPDFIEFVKNSLLSHNGVHLFPSAFVHAFLGKKPMPYAKHGRIGDIQCSLAVLRTPKQHEVEQGRSTVRSLTDLFIIMMRVDPATKTALVYTIHRRPTSDLPWLQQLKTDVKSPEHTPTYEHLVGQVLRETIMSASASLDAVRVRTDVLANTRLSVRPAEVVEAFLLRGRQAQTIRRSMAANIRVIESWSEREELHLKDDLTMAMEAATTLHGVAEEVEEIAFGGMDVRVSLVGFRAQENMKLFTYLSAITQPLALLTGWYGMNWQPMPEFLDPNGYYWFLIGAGVLFLAMIGMLVWFTRDPPQATTAIEDELGDGESGEPATVVTHEPTKA